MCNRDIDSARWTAADALDVEVQFRLSAPRINPGIGGPHLACLANKGVARLPRQLRQLFVNHTNLADHDSRQRQLVGAAHAAASWVRARRAAWSASPLEILPSSYEAPTAPATRELPVVVSFGLPAPQLRPAAAVGEWAPPIPAESDLTAASEVPRPVTTVRGPSSAGRVLSLVRSLRLPVGRWMLFTAAGLVVLMVGVTAKAYWRRGAATARAAVIALDAAVTTSRGAGKSREPEMPRKTTGRLELISEPVGAQLILDGKPRGVTPVTIEDLAPGTHQFELRSTEGSIRHSVVIKAGETAQVSESIFGGWVKVFAPFDVTIIEGARVSRLEEGNQIMLPAGRHELHVVNRTLRYDSIHRVEVRPGETATISVAPPTSTMTVNANVPAEVWIDASRAGETPLVGQPVTVGTHDVLVRRADGEERHSVVTVTVKPFMLDVDFSKP
jgi:hypothetical protein